MDGNNETEQGRRCLRLHCHHREFANERVCLRPTGLRPDNSGKDQACDHQVSMYNELRSVMFGALLLDNPLTKRSFRRYTRRLKDAHANGDENRGQQRMKNWTHRIFGIVCPLESGGYSRRYSSYAVMIRQIVIRMDCQALTREDYYTP